jgi:hypothetical protein
MNLRCVSRSHLLAFFALALVVCPITLTNSANAATDKPKSTATRTARPAQEQPAISQDKEKYLPGEQIILTGNHWAPGESVNIFVSADESEGGAAVHATADETGAFSVTTTMPDVHVGDADAPKSVVTAEASGTRSGGRAHAQFGVGRTGTDGERMIDEETYWNHRLTYPTGKYNPEWLRRAARQDAQVKRGVPAGRRRGQPSSRAFSADGGSATGSGTTSLAPSSGGNITDINSVVAGTAFLPVGPQPERMTGCASCYDYGTTEGRINDIVIDPGTTTNGSIVAYAGSVGGGVWKTTNCCTASTSWTVTTDDPLLATTSINNVTIDPNDHNTIYAGTGDLNYGSFSMGSQGVLKSTNGGNSWTTVGASVFGPEYTEPAGNFPQYNAVGKVRVDPNNSNTILAGTKVGLYISYDGGADWTGPCYTNSFSGQRQDITGLELTNMGNNVTRIFAAVGVRGYATTVQYDLGNNGANGLYLGTVPASGCPSFTAASSNANGFIFGAKVNNASPYATGALLNADSGTIYGGLNVGNQLGRIDIAVAPSNPNVLYAQVQSIAANNNNGCTNTNGCQLGMWASTDGGANWSFMTNSQGGSLFACTGNAGGADYPQNWYDQGIAVDPNNADRVLVNTFETFLVTRAGTAWYDLTCGYNGTSVNNHIVHVDHHAQAFVPGSSDIFLVGDDGGIHGTNNASVANCVPMTTNNITNCTSDSVRPTWFNMDTGINSIEFYSGDISGNFATSAFPALAAGAQDNGPSTVTFNGYPTGPVMWQMGTSGDGFSGLIDPIGTGGTAANGAPQLRFFLGSNSGTFKRCVSNCTDPNAAWPTVGGSFTADQQSFVLPVHLFHGGIPGGDDCPPAGPSGGCGHLLAGTTRVWETITGSAPQRKSA